MKRSRSLSDSNDDVDESPLAKRQAVENMNGVPPQTSYKQPVINGKSDSYCSYAAPIQSKNPLNVVRDNRDSAIDLTFPEKAIESLDVEEYSKQDLPSPGIGRDQDWGPILDTLAARKVHEREDMEADKRRRLLISSVTDPAAIQEAVQLRRTIRRSTYYPPAQGLQLSLDDLQILEEQFSADVHVQLESM